MIRSVLGLFVFAVALCAYIIVRPGTPPEELAALPAPTLPADVSRASSETLLPGTPLPEPAATPPVMAPAPAEDPVQEAPVIQTNSATISETTSNVLAGLGLELEVPDLPSGDEMADMSSAALTNISASTGRAIPTRPAEPRRALETLVVSALQDGRPDAEIDEMINTAARAGDVSVPEILVTSDGRVDTAVLLQAIIQQANIAAGGPAPAIPDTPTGSADGVEVRFVKRHSDAEQYTFYTVNRGDSLGAIAQKFYGSVDKFPVIYQANRDILQSPDEIRVGQRLSIPRIDDQI